MSGVTSGAIFLQQLTLSAATIKGTQTITRDMALSDLTEEQLATARKLASAIWANHEIIQEFLEGSGE